MSGILPTKLPISMRDMLMLILIKASLAYYRYIRIVEDIALIAQEIILSHQEEQTKIN